MLIRRFGLLAVLVFALLFAAYNSSAQQPSQRSTLPRQTPTPLPGDDVVERVDVDLTNVLINVVDKKRRFVTTLKREDIRVLEDDVPQEIFTFQRETELPLSLAILIDTSASQEGVIEDERGAATAFLDAVLRPEKDTASIVSFTGITRIEQPLTRDRAALRDAIKKVKVEHSINDPECEGGDNIPEEDKLRCLTGVWDSIFLTIREVLMHTPQSTRRAIIILTDGDDTSSKTRIYQAIESAVQHNTAIYSIGIRDRDLDYGELRKDYLRKVSDETAGRAFFPRSRVELDAAFAQINDELRSQYLLAYSPSNKKRDGSFRRVTVEVVNRELRKEKLRLLYRQGYYARNDNPEKPPQSVHQPN